MFGTEPLRRIDYYKDVISILLISRVLNIIWPAKCVTKKWNRRIARSLERNY